MFKFLRKYKFQFDVIAVIVFAIGSIFRFIDYSEDSSKKMNLFGGIVFGLMAIFRTDDVVENLKKKKKLD